MGLFPQIPEGRDRFGGALGRVNGWTGDLRGLFQLRDSVTHEFRTSQQNRMRTQGRDTWSWQKMDLRVLKELQGAPEEGLAVNCPRDLLISVPAPRSFSQRPQGTPGDTRGGCARVTCQLSLSC